MSANTKCRKILKRLLEHGEWLAMAESCTGGLISSTFTKQPGVSGVFSGGLVAYSNRTKTTILGVSGGTIKKNGAVSRPVARAMAVGARRIFESHWALSVTGIAGPSGGTREKPVGTVFFAVVGPGFEKVEKRHFKGNRQSIQNQSMNAVMDLLLQGLNKKRRKTNGKR